MSSSSKQILGSDLLRLPVKTNDIQSFVMLSIFVHLLQLQQLMEPQKQIYEEHFDKRRADVAISTRKRLRKNEILKRRIASIQPGIFDRDLGSRYFPALSNVLLYDRFTQISRLFNSPNYCDVLEGCVDLRKLLTESEVLPIQLILQNQLLPKIMDLADQDFDIKIKVEATWILANFSSGNTDQCDYLVKRGGIQLLLKLMDSTELRVLEQVLWAIGNLAADCERYREELLSCHVIEKITAVLSNKPSVEFLKILAWVTTTFMHVKEDHDYENLRDMIPLLCTLVRELDLEGDADDIESAVWALSLLTEKSKKSRRVLMQTNAIPKVLNLLILNRQDKSAISGLRLVGNLSANDNDECTYLIKCGTLPVIDTYLDNPNHAVRKEACWVLSNIAGGSPHQAKMIFDNEYSMVKLMDIMEKDYMMVRREAAWVMANLCYTVDKELAFVYFKSGKALRLFCEFLDHNEDQKCLLVGLTGVMNLLQLGAHFKVDGLNPFRHQVESLLGNKLQQLQLNPSRVVYNKCIQILSKHLDN